MATSRTRKRQQQLKGVIPALWQNLTAIVKWIFSHPQPVFILFSLSVVIWAISTFVQQAEAFKVTGISVPAGMSLELPANLIGQNIWQTPLQAVSERLTRQRPDLKEIRVIRQLPNVITVHAIERIPVAQIKLDRWYIVDQDGFILPEGQSMPFERLARFSGFIRADAPLKIGKLNADERLKLAIRILPLLQRSPALASRQLIELNVSDVQQIRFVLDGDLEIRCGTEAELQAHLTRLQATLKTLAKQPMALRYIDVRFPDPVVGPQ